MHRVSWRCWCDDQTYYKVLRHSQLILGFIWFRSGLGFIVIQDDSSIVRLNKLTSTWGTTFEAGHCMTSNKRRVSVCPRIAWLITGGFFVCDIIYIYMYVCMYVCMYVPAWTMYMIVYVHAWTWTAWTYASTLLCSHSLVYKLIELCVHPKSNGCLVLSQ